MGGQTWAPKKPTSFRPEPERPRRPAWRSPEALVGETLRTPGEPLARDVGARVRLDHNFRDVRVHRDQKAAESAAAVGARAYNVGRHIVFGAGEYAPQSRDGRQLLEHELTHVAQRGSDIGDSHTPPVIADANHPAERAAERFSLHRLQTGAPKVGAHLLLRQQAQLPTRPTTAQDIIDYLHELATFMADRRRFAGELLRFAQVDKAPRAGDERRRAQKMVNQQAIQRNITDATRAFESMYSGLPANDAARATMRTSLEAVLKEARLSASFALGLTDASGAGQAAGQDAYAETLARIVEASPMTSTGLAALTTFTAADETQAQAYQTELRDLLDDLLARLPGLHLSPAQQDATYQRLQVALRRAFTTISTGPAGRIDVRSISDPTIVDKYQRVSAMLAQGVANAPHVDLITDRMPPFTLPNPVPDVTAQLPHPADLTHVPDDERDSVRFAIQVAETTTFGASSTVQLRNAVWPVVIPIRHGATTTTVQYEFVFDASGNVRAERLGVTQPREVDPAFSTLSTADKKAALVRQFGLAGVDDRPAAHGRAAASWTDDELVQLKTAYDLIPPAQRAGLSGVTVVRDHVSPIPQAPGVFQFGRFHSGADAAFDTPAPPAHGPPHIHYFDEAFRENSFIVSSAPGVGGPGADFGLIHETGHAEGDAPERAAFAEAHTSNAALNAAIHTLNARLTSTPLPPAQHAAVATWQAAFHAAGLAVMAVGGGSMAGPTGTVATTALASEATALAALDASGAPALLIAAADAASAALRPLLTKETTLQTARGQNDIFVAIANRFGFYKFTDYARTGGANDWFAETYALFVTDPSRLNQMNRNVFLWFQAGMPLDPAWNPPPAP